MARDFLQDGVVVGLRLVGGEVELEGAAGLELGLGSAGLGEEGGDVRGGRGAEGGDD